MEGKLCLFDTFPCRGPSEPVPSSLWPPRGWALAGYKPALVAWGTPESLSLALAGEVSTFLCE